ncbi:MAG: hypothetical protein WBA16_03070 [Nonlabens sp.]
MSTLLFKMKKDWNDHFMLYAATSIIVSTCLGGLAVMSVFQNGNSLFAFLQIFTVVILCTTVLASILTVQKSEYVMNALIASVTICSSILALNLLF